jgi:hypothetical protein
MKTVKTAKNKKAIAITLLLIFAVSSWLFLTPAVNAHDPPWEITSFAYIWASPDPVGVNQRVLIVMWVDRPLPSAHVSRNDIRRHDYKLTITDPDGDTEVMEWPIVWDTTSIQYTTYTPSKVGTYTLLFEYAGQEYTWSGSYQGDIFLPASKTTTFTVQEEQLPEAITSFPLPTEYWTRPIEGQNSDWWTISSNWLGGASIRSGETVTGGAGYGRYQPDGIAPESPHVMWTRPIQDGGVVGGSGYHVPGTTYYMGGSYNTRFGNALVMHGRLYYELPYGNSGGGGGWICVDLQTGEEIWYNAEMGVSLPEPTFGYLYDFDMYNQHGIIPSNGWLISQSGRTSITWNFIEPLTGKNASMVVENVPSGTEVLGPLGENLRYVWNSAGKWLAQWNSSKVFDDESSGTRDASDPDSYDWNVTIPSVGDGSWSIYRDVIFDNILLLTQGNLGAGNLQPSEGATITAISLDPDQRGRKLWSKYYPPAPGNTTREIIALDADAGVFVTQDKETMEYRGFSLSDGSLSWTASQIKAEFDTLRSTSLAAYGNLYSAGFDGICYCYDMATGDLLWTYGNGGEGNSTYAGLDTAWGHYPIFVDIIADGKIYLGTTEHSPGSPFYKNTRYRCLNATTGEEIWTMMGWGTGMYVGRYDVIADGFFVYLNCYDMQVYCVGKGPSATTVTAGPEVSVYGDSVLVKGFVTDIAAGTKQTEQAGRFPDGVPAVSDESMGDWMEYVYMQKPKPTDVVGVEVVVYVSDPNDNYYEVGRTTSDENGFFSCVFEPEVPGKYTVIAKFEGSESYWPSDAITAINVEEAPAATPPPTPEPESVADLYFVPMSIGTIVAIIVVGLLLFLMLRKR